MVYQKESFKLLEKHEKSVGLLRVEEARRNKKIKNENLQLCDFLQGAVGNCGLMAALAALSLRPEFEDKIAPAIDISSGLLRFKTFLFGEPAPVTVDDALPFVGNEWLAYAGSRRYDEEGEELVCASSFFEKAFVKLACSSDYLRSTATEPLFAFTCFSGCMTGYRLYEADEPKDSLADLLRLELGCGGSVVLGVTPVDPESKGHCYTVVGLAENRIKLYDPSNDDSTDGLFSSTGADPETGELWVAVEDIEKCEVSVSSLYPENMYESVFQLKKKISLSVFDKDHILRKDVCKFTLKEASQMMVNFYCYSHELKHFDFIIRTEDGKKVEIDFLLPEVVESFYGCHRQKGEILTHCHQKFELRPNTYVVSLELRTLQVEEATDEDVNFLLRLGSFSEFTFEELNV